MSLHLSGFTPSGFQDVRRQEVSHLCFPRAESPKHQTLTCFTILGFPPSGILGCATTGGLAPRFLESRKYETPNSNMLHYFWVSSIKISGSATTGGLAPRFPGSRNSKTPDSNILHYFRNSSIKISRVRGFETSEHMGPALRYPGY
jgi:hypothetical protein